MTSAHKRLRLSIRLLVALISLTMVYPKATIAADWTQAKPCPAPMRQLSAGYRFFSRPEKKYTICIHEQIEDHYAEGIPKMEAMTIE
jgi:hypothetical protein